jgi:hypothetical protein
VEQLRLDNQNLQTSVDALTAQQTARDELYQAREDEIREDIARRDHEQSAWVQERTRFEQDLKQAQDGHAAEKARLDEEIAKLVAERDAERDARVNDLADRDAERNSLREDVDRIKLELDDALVKLSVAVAEAETLKRQKEDVERSSDVFREQYLKASGFADEVRAENKALAQRAEIAEGRAEEGVAMVRGMYEGRLKTLGQECEQWKVRAEVVEERERRTQADEVRARAAEWGEWKKRAEDLEKQVTAERDARSKFMGTMEDALAEHERLREVSRQRATRIHRLEDALRRAREEGVEFALKELESAVAGIRTKSLTELAATFSDTAGADVQLADDDTKDAEGVSDEDGDQWVYPCKYRDGLGGEIPCEEVFRTKDVRSAFVDFFPLAHA